MASNKNQHFVPQCYLKRFSNENSNSSICLYNYDRRFFVANASIKSQCSKNYFYGEDLKLEKSLQPIEGEYSNLVKRIVSPGYKLNEEDSDFLLDFWLLQHMRTEAASKRYVEIVDGMSDNFGIDNFKVELDEAVLESMKSFIDTRHIIKDMKVCLIKNKSKKRFYTSDDPAIHTNKWYFIDERARGMSYGLGSAGNLFLLPLTPYVLMVCYDSDVYDLRPINGWVNTKNGRDVDCFNYFQLLACNGNVYTGNNSDKVDIEILHQDVESIKSRVKFKINYAIFVNDENGYESYKVVDRNEAGEHTKALVYTQSIRTYPPEWPTQIRWKNKGFVMGNGSGIGYIRQLIAELKYADIKNFKKINIR